MLAITNLRTRSYGNLSVNYRGRDGRRVPKWQNRWEVTNCGVTLIEFPSRLLARLYRKALYWGNVDVLAVVIWFSFAPRKEAVN